MTHKELAEACGADVGTVQLFGSNYDNMLVFNAENFAKFCKKLVKITAKDNLHAIRLYRAYLDTLIEEWNDHCGSAWEGDYQKLIDRIETDIATEAYV